MLELELELELELTAASRALARLAAASPSGIDLSEGARRDLLACDPRAPSEIDRWLRRYGPALVKIASRASCTPREAHAWLDASARWYDERAAYELRVEAISAERRIAPAWRGPSVIRSRSAYPIKGGITLTEQPVQGRGPLGGVLPLQGDRLGMEILRAACARAESERADARLTADAQRTTRRRGRVAAGSYGIGATYHAEPRKYRRRSKRRR